MNPEVSRDLETVILKAIAKEPPRRYSTAGALAADLDALLEYRPITARRPGLWERGRGWLRRNRVASAVLLTVLIATAVVLSFIVFESARDLENRRGRAREIVAGVKKALEEHALERTELLELERELERLGEEDSMPTSRADFVEHEKTIRRLDDFRARRVERFAKILRDLDEAELIDPEVEGAEDSRADLYMERWRVAQTARDHVGMRYYEGLVRAFDGDRRHDRELDGIVRVKLQTYVPGSEVYLFRHLEQSKILEGGEMRCVPVPIRGSTGEVPPGTWCLRVVEAVSPIERLDLIFEVAGHPIQNTLLVSKGVGKVRPLDRLVAIDGKPVRDLYDVEGPPAGGGRGTTRRRWTFEGKKGSTEIDARRLVEAGIAVATPREIAERGGVRARVYRRGKVLELDLPDGLTLRTTADPLLLTPECMVGRPPIALDLAQGTYSALIAKEGYRPRGSRLPD